ncbi:hypothetical protein ACWOC1_06705 [Enterococcus quebecensis]|uniref:Uncharacterized protein n=1 Tax=Enterococcus quebecensis TaxID=903983 RepID=A0A1E5GT57_9ENTE|nr:hypothetical protein [Enterococcus quebecensis]OEG15450.1 hypothetical protein BCR23_08245 [Enterococcus quebecensis]OJG74052.1 hypothetical protein RV12_GL000400 [Enterococcus quebecensis]
MEEYEQIYNALEAEVMELSYSITFSEEQKHVYSPKIADLVLRSASLLESALKYQYKDKKDTQERLKYDDDRLIEELGLEKKFTYVHWKLFQFQKKSFYSFKRNEERVNKMFSNVSKSGNNQFSWNNAYQSLRHEFIKSIPYYGTLYYLFEILAALHLVLDAPSRIFCDPTQNDDGSWYAARYLGNGSWVSYAIEIEE